MVWIFGPSDWSRTSGLLNPIQARYQTALHPDVDLRLEYNTTFEMNCQGLFLFFVLFCDIFRLGLLEQNKVVKMRISETKQDF